ncbi:MAG: hypothetical protein AAFY20_27035, partial [Cyanobacteria bacterium J06639_14]
AEVGVAKADAAGGGMGNDMNSVFGIRKTLRGGHSPTEFGILKYLSNLLDAVLVGIQNISLDTRLDPR